VGGTANIDNLHAGTKPIELKVEGAPPPPLILDRGTLLGGVPIADVSTMSVTTAKGPPIGLKTVNRLDGPAFFDVDPGGFGIEGVQNNQELTIDFTFMTAGRNPVKQHVITTLDMAVPVFRAK
jgi:hypothetical protein